MGWNSCSLPSVSPVLPVTCFHLLLAGEEHRSHHSDLRLRGTRTEAHLETRRRDLRRGLSPPPARTRAPHLLHHLILFLHPCVPLTQILTMFEDNYPEGLKRVFLIKGTLARLHIFKGVSPLFFWPDLFCCLGFVFAAAPKMFPMAYNLIKHFLCEETRQKIIVLGSESSGPRWSGASKGHANISIVSMCMGLLKCSIASGPLICSN